MSIKYIKHHGIKGMKWGVRRYQNEDGSLTPRGKKHYDKQDSKWVNKNANKVYVNAKKKSNPEMREYLRTELVGQSGRTAINKYNRKLADVMRKHTNDIRTPSGKVVDWVAKRGEIGVHMAIKDQGYNIDQLKNGVWPDGRVGYKNKKVEMG